MAIVSLTIESHKALHKAPFKKNFTLNDLSFLHVIPNPAF